MAMKVNYGFQRSERDRAKQAKKEAKAREKAAAAENPQPAADATTAESTEPKEGA